MYSREQLGIKYQGNHYTLTSSKFGSLCQNYHPDMIFSVAWGKGVKFIYQEPPKFQFFDCVDDIVDYFNNTYIKPFVLATNERHAGNSTALLFEDDDMKIEMIYYEHNSRVHQFYDQKIYQELKEKLSLDTL